MNGWNDLKEYKTRSMIALVLAGIFAIGGMIVPFIITATRTTYMNPLLWMLFGWGGAIIIGLCSMKTIKTYRKEYKDRVVAQAAGNMFDNYQYFPFAGIEKEEVAMTNMMMMGNRYNSEDLVEGSYKGVPFRRADMYIAQHTSNGKSSHTTVYLRGTWIVFRYNKNFNTDLQIASKDFGYEKKNTSRLFTRSTTRRHAMQTEDMEFNGMFECTCQNETEAFYLLTPRVMQMLKLLRNELRAPIMVGFVNNMLHFAISSRKNHMEPPIFGSLNPALAVEEARVELKAICNIIDAFSMDRSIFLGETDTKRDNEIFRGDDADW